MARPGIIIKNTKPVEISIQAVSPESSPSWARALFGVNEQIRASRARQTQVLLNCIQPSPFKCKISEMLTAV